MKYIIKNCPAYSKDALDFCFAKNATEAVCYKCTDCLLKRIVEKCKRTLSINKGLENEYTLGKISEAEYILKDIEIEECE